MTEPLDLDLVADYLRAQYGVAVTSVVPIDDDPEFRPYGSWPGHYPSTLVVRRPDGAPWIARISAASPGDVERVAEDAEVLRFLATQGFPAERLAREDAVSVLDGTGVIVTEFIAGGRPTDAEGRVRSPAVHQELAGLLGRLHSLPATGGVLERDGGAEVHGGSAAGRPGRDLEAAQGFLVGVEDVVPPEGRGLFEYLSEQVADADDAEGLPEAFTHSNFHAWAAVGPPGGLRIVGWAGSGRGPRLPGFAWLLRTAAEAGDANVDAVVRGYREYVELTPTELDRLPGVLKLRPLWLACLDYRESVRRGVVPSRSADGAGYGFYRPDAAERLAERVAFLLQKGL